MITELNQNGDFSCPACGKTNKLIELPSLDDYFAKKYEISAECVHCEFSFILDVSAFLGDEIEKVKEDMELDQQYSNYISEKNPE